MCYFIALKLLFSANRSYLDVDEMLALGDDLDVGIVDGLFMVLYAC